MVAPELSRRRIIDPMGHCRFPSPFYGKTRMACLYDAGDIVWYRHNWSDLPDQLNGAAKLA